MAGGSTKQETTIPGRSAQEQNVLDVLQKLGITSMDQLGDLSRLARGEVGGPTEADTRLVQESIGRSGDIARRELESVYGQLSGQLDESLSARGVQGSSIESVDRALLNKELLRQAATSIDRSRIEGGNLLANLPFQRAGVQLGANQLLMQQITNALPGILQYGLGERSSQGTTTQTQKPGALDYLNTGIGLAGTIMGGGGKK